MAELVDRLEVAVYVAAAAGAVAAVLALPGGGGGGGAAGLPDCSAVRTPATGRVLCAEGSAVATVVAAGRPFVSPDVDARLLRGVLRDRSLRLRVRLANKSAWPQVAGTPGQLRVVVGGEPVLQRDGAGAGVAPGGTATVTAPFTLTPRQAAAVRAGALVELRVVPFAELGHPTHRVGIIRVPGASLAR